MHCIILANQTRAFPGALCPIKGRAVIDYLIDDVLLQKEIRTISVIANHPSSTLIAKHVKNAYPDQKIPVTLDTVPSFWGGVKRRLQNRFWTCLPAGRRTPQYLLARMTKEDILILQGNVFTSLRLHDFIRYFKQFKTITKAAYDKQSPKEIPFYIIPKEYVNCVSHLDHLPQDIITHTYNCGTATYFTKSISA